MANILIQAPNTPLTGYGKIALTLAKTLAKKHNIYYHTTSTITHSYTQQKITYYATRHNIYALDTQPNHKTLLQNILEHNNIHYGLTFYDLWPTTLNHLQHVMTDSKTLWLPHHTINTTPLPLQHYLNTKNAYSHIAPSRFVEQQLRNTGLTNVTYIPHFVNTKKLYPNLEERQKYREIFNITPDTFVFLTIARNNQIHKDITGVMQAFRQAIDKNNTPMKLIILTDTQENTESPNLNITRHHLNLDNDVIFPDIKNTGENATITPEGTGIPHYVGLGLSDEGLRHLYNMSDCFVTASTGESFCILPNTKIITDNGTKKIQEVSISNKLLTHTGEFRKINKIFRREYIGSIIKIKCYGSFEEINMTTNHKILVSKKNKRKFNNLEWVESEKIEKGDFVVLPKANKIFNELIFDIKNLSEKYDGDDNNVWYCKKFSIKEKKIKLIKLNRYVNFDKELAKLFGWYLSEGDCANGVTVGFSFNIKEDAYINEVIFLVNKIFRIDKYTLIKIKNKNAKHLIFSSKILSDFFSYFCGKGAKNKHIPKEFLYGDENNLLLLIDRYWKGDGNLRNNFYQATTASEKLAYDLKIGLIRLGKNASVRRNKRKRKYNTEQVYITTEYVVSYLSKRSNHSVKIINKDDNCFFRVKSIEKELYKGEVFNFEIDVDNTYCTSNFIVHNCIPLIEAQACGVPCIMPNNTVATEHIIKPCTGIVADVSRELYVEQLHASVQLVSIPSLTNAMTRMMTEKNKYVQNCLKNAKKYDTKKVMKKWLTFFDKIIEHRKNTLNYKNSIGI